MIKKWAIFLVLAGEALIYLVLLVGLPMFTEWMYSLPDICAELKGLGGDIFWVLYPIPGLFGIMFIVIILKQKKEAKDG